MEVNFHELNNADACIIKRRFRSMQGEAKDNIIKAGIIKRAIDDVFRGYLTAENLTLRLKQDMHEVMYPSNKQRDIHAEDAAQQAARFVRSETRPLQKGLRCEVKLHPDLSVWMKPDYVSVTQNTIEVIRIRCSKPSITEKAAKDDLGLYALMCYGRDLLQPGEAKTIVASYYFLRKATDRAGGEDPNFDTDFFDGKGGKNVIRIADEYSNPLARPTAMDVHFLPIVERFIAGIREDECTEEDCSRCSLKELCKYTDAPACMTKELKNRNLSDLSLTKAQEDVMEYEKGICRVNAGAGAGKTMVVSLRAATLLEKGVKPEELLLMTFTNSGAEEMRARIGMVARDFGIEQDLSAMRICTFNSFGNEIVCREYQRLGFSEPPKLIDDVERSRMIANLLNGHYVPDLDYRNFTMDSPSCMGALEVAKRVFAILKAKRYNKGELKELRTALGRNCAPFASYESLEELIDLYDAYEAGLKADNLIEYADQAVLLFELLRQDPYYFDSYGFKHVLIDEFQDSDAGQIELLRILRRCPSFESLMVVGDDSQAIYGFRDTSPEFMLKFAEYMGIEQVDDIFLAENHRSTPEIIAFANEINARRVEKIDKNLIATRPSGKPVVAKGFLTREEEREYVLTELKKRLDDGVKPEEIAIIASTRSELQTMADVLKKEGIPSVLLNPEPMLENSRIRAALSFARFLKDENNQEDALAYVNAKKGGHILSTLRDTDVPGLIDEAKADREKVNGIATDEGKKQTLMELLRALDESSDEVYVSFLKTLDFKPMEKIMEYCDDFVRFGSAATYRRIHDYPGVVLITAHSSKGLEWPVVFNMISKYHTPEIQGGSNGFKQKEEKMRLLFVSCTRARDELIITGQYVAYGKRGEYTYNIFLNTCCDIAGCPWTETQVEQERFLREMEKKAAKKAAEEAAKSA